MVVGFTTTYAINAYHHWCEFKSRSGRGVQHYVIEFVSDLCQVGGFLRVLRFPPPIKLTATMSLKYCWKWRSTPSSKQTIQVILKISMGTLYKVWNIQDSILFRVRFREVQSFEHVSTIVKIVYFNKIRFECQGM
jgi:hypothetical protein